jgi:hypothetical protein
MKKMYVIGTLMVVAICLMAGQAGATIITLGDPIITGSSDQRFRMSSSNSDRFNRIDALMISSDSYFKGPAIREISRSDWQPEKQERPDHISASGGDTDSIDCNIHFGTDIDHKLDFILTWYHDNDKKEEWHVSYDGSGRGDGWDFEDCNNGHKVPEPTSVLLLGMGIVGLGIMRKKITG